MRRVRSQGDQQGGTSADCGFFWHSRSIWQPEYTERAEIRCDVKLASFSGHARKTPGQTDEEREWSLALQATLEAVVLVDKYPKSMIDVFVLVLERDGSELAAAINAASLGLADAGIEMSGLVAAVTVGCGPSGPLLDLSADDEKMVSGGITLASLPCSNAVVQFHTLSGVLPSGGTQGVPTLTQLALDANARLRDLAAMALRASD